MHKRPLPGMPTIRGVDPGNADQRITHKESLLQIVFSPSRPSSLNFSDPAVISFSVGSLSLWETNRH